MTPAMDEVPPFTSRLTRLSDSSDASTGETTQPGITGRSAERPRRGLNR